MKSFNRMSKFNELQIKPLFDVHIGSVQFKDKAEDKFYEAIEYIGSHKNCYTIIGGDLLDTGTNTSKTSPSTQKYWLKDQIELAIRFLKPIKDKIFFVLTGNHEARLEHICGYNPLQAVCGMLGVDFVGYSCVMRIIVGDKKPKHKNVRGCISYVIYAHHTTGGGSTVGGKLNRVAKLREIVSNADVYLGGHNHNLASVSVMSRMYDYKTLKVIDVEQYLVNCGGFQIWDESYVEKAQMSPTKIGSPLIYLSGQERLIKCLT